MQIFVYYLIKIIQFKIKRVSHQISIKHGQNKNNTFLNIVFIVYCIYSIFIVFIIIISMIFFSNNFLVIERVTIVRLFSDLDSDLDQFYLVPQTYNMFYNNIGFHLFCSHSFPHNQNGLSIILFIVLFNLWYYLIYGIILW